MAYAYSDGSEDERRFRVSVADARRLYRLRELIIARLISLWQKVSSEERRIFVSTLTNDRGLLLEVYLIRIEVPFGNRTKMFF